VSKQHEPVDAVELAKALAEFRELARWMHEHGFRKHGFSLTLPYAGRRPKAVRMWDASKYRLFRDPPLDITSGVDPAEYIERQRGDWRPGDE
jgi:predicted double-glycine peptidase